MEAVRAFNNELSSLYEGKPPVSRAKMAQVTKYAIKAIKFYKHVVQSVEKFIQKCKPEYKVPGLYVIDSIVRQSRHQFGPEKDVFSPRFTKNIVTTFTNLFKCPVEERSRVVRVLNLWQKNCVFPVEVIQPLLDLAADPNNPELVAAAQRSVDAVVSVTQKVPLPGTQASSNGGDSNSNQILQQTEMLSTITKLLQQAQEGSITGTAPESQLQQLQHLQQQLVMQTERISKPQQQSTPPIDSNLLAQIQVLTNQLLSKTSEGVEDMVEDDNRVNSGEPLFNKKLLDFDYGDSDEDDDRQDHHQHHHHHHHHFQQRPPPIMHQGMPPVPQDQNHLQQIQIQQMAQQQEQLQSEIGAQEQLRRRVLEQQQFEREIGQGPMGSHHPQHGYGQNMNVDRRQDEVQNDRNGQENQDRADQRRRRGSRERSRSPRRRSRRSRSRSRDRKRRSRSRDRHRRTRSREREKREKERERKKRGLPPLRENNISICSTTLWFGHLTKHTTEKELREHIEKYGTIRTINMIPPRGCAFVCLTKRKDAFKALDRLKGVKINGNSLKVAWAPGIGVKESMFKDLWDVEQGVTYIPWEQLPTDVAPFIAGGMVDEDSLPERLKGMSTGEEDIVEEPQQIPSVESGITQHENMMPSQQPPQHMSHMSGQPPPNFALAGQGLLTLLAASGPLGLLGGPPPMGLQPGMGPNLGGPGNMGGLNNIRLPNNLGALNNMGGLPGLGGPGPNMPGMRPPHMNMGPQGHMMGGNRMGGPMGGHPNHGMDVRPPPAGMNSPGRPFGQFGNMVRFPHMQNPGGMRPPFFSSDSNDSDQAGMGEGNMRAMAEPKEWPPDDEVNAEDEPDEDVSMESDERMLPAGGHRMTRPGMPNMRGMGNPFGPRGPMMPGQGNPNPMLNMTRAQSPKPGMPPLLSLHMMPPGQQQSVLGGGPSPNFTMTPGGMRLPMSAVGMRPGLGPGSASPHILPPSTGAPVSANGSMVVARPGQPSNMSMNVGGPDSPEVIMSNSDQQSSEEDMMRSHIPGPMSLMQMQGGNRPPGGPFLGRGFAPMTIRPRGGAGLLGVRPGMQGGGGFNRFGGPRPFMGPFGGMDRPPFGNRFGLPFRPPVGFFGQDERDDRDENRPLPRVDFEDHSRAKDLDDQNEIHEFDERREINLHKGRHQDMELQQDITDRSRVGRSSGRQSRWHDETEKPELAVEEQTAAPAVVESTVIAPVVVESTVIAPAVVESTVVAPAVVESTVVASAVAEPAISAPDNSVTEEEIISASSQPSEAEKVAPALEVQETASIPTTVSETIPVLDTSSSVVHNGDDTPVAPADTSNSDGENSAKEGNAGSETKS